MANARDVVNNMFNKPSIIGMVFNPQTDGEAVVTKEELELLLPGEKPKPDGFRD